MHGLRSAGQKMGARQEKKWGLGRTKNGGSAEQSKGTFFEQPQTDLTFAKNFRILSIWSFNQREPKK
jgi:hypothetical protein